MSALLQPVPSPTIGSSVVPVILGYERRFTSRWKLWMEMTGLIPGEHVVDTENEDGNMVEPGIGKRYAQERGLVWGVDFAVGPPFGTQPFVGPEPWMTCHPDFLRIRQSQAIGVVEAKAPRTFDDEPSGKWGPSGTDHAPRAKLAQCMWQMVVMRVETADLAAYARYGRKGDKWRVYTIPFRERVARAIVDRCRDWLTHHVIEGNPPAIDDTGDCGRGLALLNPARPDRVVVHATAADLALARDLAATRRQLAELETRKTHLENRLRDRIGTAYALADGDATIATWGARKGRSTIDTDALRRDHPAIADRYTRTGAPSRALNFDPEHHFTEEDETP